jgi:putative GTP pyrophosphokinase
MKHTPKFEQLHLQYTLAQPLYHRLGSNVSSAIEEFLESESISTNSVKFRIKSFQSLYRKIESKGYTRRLTSVQDLCAIRITCYLQSDILRIRDMLAREFELIEDTDKCKHPQATEFGYRSHHVLARVKSSWLQAPNYRRLDGLIFEVQIRTVLMDAWAEIEHKLAYKRTEHIPPQFRRRFSRISAKLEEADEQFEELYRDIRTWQQELIDASATESSFPVGEELNLDSLQAFLDFSFPTYNRDIHTARDLLDHLLRQDHELTSLAKLANVASKDHSNATSQAVRLGEMIEEQDTRSV